VRIALAQVNPTVGALKANAALVIERMREAQAAGADIVAFPELVISGYPPEDLLLKDHFLSQCWEALLEVAAANEGICALVGVPIADGPAIYNAAGIICGGRVAGAYRKICLPNYAVFDEKRYFTPGDRTGILDLGGTRIGVNICEDIWEPCGPTVVAAREGAATVVINLSMSPYHVGKGKQRETMLAERARDAGAHVCYLNGVGGQDELVFDGQSLVFGPDGELLARAGQFEEQLLIVDLDVEGPRRGAARERAAAAPASPSAVDAPGRPSGDRPAAAVCATSEPQPGGGSLDTSGSEDTCLLPSWTLEVIRVERQAGAAAAPAAGAASAPSTGAARPDGPVATRAAAKTDPAGDAPSAATAALITHCLSVEAEIYAALCLGVGDYVRKNRFQQVVMGISGGIDSALTACLAADALGNEKVNAVSMPSRYSSSGTKDDARETAERLGVRFYEIPIEDVYGAYLETLAPYFAGWSPGVTEQNIQARIRGNLLMALSNKFGYLVLTTGNKSEMAVGYATLYGDMAGGFAVLKDVPKTLVYQLAAYRNSLGPGEGPIPQDTIDRAPSAELAADQTDQDTLPPYDILDRIIEAYVVNDESVEEIVASGIDRAEVQRVVAMVDLNEYKRRQAAPGVRITPKAFGKDRRLPITNQYRG
jgi:NAD+ synthase (glutamine-hydrolysing)